MIFKVAKETRNFSIIVWPDSNLNIEECQALYDEGYRPIFAELRDSQLELLCEKVDIAGIRGLH